MDNIDRLDEFDKKMKDKYPEMLSDPYVYMGVGEGWWPVLETLIGQINSYTKWRNNTRAALLKDNPHGHKIPNEVPQVRVIQVKEKFGGLRFYYDGGDEHISGKVTMAEIWAGHVREECGKPGKRRNTGWIKTLCDEHAAEREAKYKERLKA